MKRKILALILIVFSIISFCSCAKSDEYDDFKEVYNVQSKYYFYVQPQYADSVSNLGYSNTTIVRYTTQAYAMLTVSDYFDNFSYEQIGGLTRENFSMGNAYLDDTFNNRKYIQNYFESYLSSSNSYADISQVEKITVNEHDFWLCHCYYYESDFDPKKDDPIDELKGEGYLYYTIHDGITYFINVNSVDSFISETPEANDFINNFYIGTRLQSSIRFVWLVLALLVVIDIVFVLSAFFKIKIEPAVIIEKIRVTLQSLLKKKKYTSEEFEQALSEVKLDTVLGRIDYEPSVEDDIFVKLKKSEIYLDEILGRNSESETNELSIYEHLDIILERISKYPKAVFKPKAKESVPVVDTVDMIYRGEIVAKTDEEPDCVILTPIEHLDIILGRTSPCIPSVTMPKEPDGFIVKLQKFMQKHSENMSIKRIRREENRITSEVARKEKAIAKAQEKELRKIQKYTEKYNKIFAELDQKYDMVGYETYIPDVKKSDISSDDILANLDIILERTLFSKLDRILNRTNLVYSHKYFGDESEQVIQRKNAIAELIVDKQNREAYLNSLIANVSDNKRIMYLSSTSDVSSSASVMTLNGINNAEIEYHYDEPIMENVEYNNITTAGSNMYQRYIKTEKAFQKFAHKTGVAFRAICAKIKKLIDSIGENKENTPKTSEEDEK